MKSVIVKDVSKIYSVRNRNNNFKEQLKESVFGLFSKETGNGEEQFYALKNISFELDKGDVLGIIGDNGAGKSTLLKIISGVSQPSTGEVTLNGQISSILEIGTGFHMELTGRENIFLSGSILGMSREAIQKNFDSIVGFSGLKDFIDVAIKRYSSGMYLRLAFSVLAHLSTDIILLDEIIHVGDAEFRLKSYNKIKELARSGKTILIISHDLASISDLCTKCMLLEKGNIRLSGSTHEIVRQYIDKSLAKYINTSAEDESRKLKEEMETLQDKIRVMEHNIKEKEEILDNSVEKEQTLVSELTKLREQSQELNWIRQQMKSRNDEIETKNTEAIASEKLWEDEANAPGNHIMKIKHISITNAEGKKTINQADDIVIEIEYWKYEEGSLLIGLLATYNFGNLAFGTSSSLGSKQSLNNAGTGLMKNTCTINKYLLNEGIFTLSFYFYNENMELVYSFQNAMFMKVEYLPVLFEKSDYKGNLMAPFAPKFQWT